jgi:hypothetical protein
MKRKWLAAVIGPCVLGLLLVPLGTREALGEALRSNASEGRPRSPETPSAVLNLRLNQSGATRVLAELGGAAQEEDKEKPRSMDAPAPLPKSARNAAAVKKEAPPPDRFAFVKDWPFWVIVGGVVLAGVGGYMLLRNSNDKAPCAPQFNAGCFP